MLGQRYSLFIAAGKDATGSFSQRMDRGFGHRVTGVRRIQDAVLNRQVSDVGQSGIGIA
jgi:flagellar hook-associated protein FlgK